MDPSEDVYPIKNGDFPAYYVSVQECNHLTTPNLPISLIPLICSRSLPPNFQAAAPCCGFEARSQNVTPLYIAAQSGHVEVVVTLLFARAESNKCTETWLKNSRNNCHHLRETYMKTVNIPPKQEVGNIIRLKSGDRYGSWGIAVSIGGGNWKHEELQAATLKKLQHLQWICLMPTWLTLYK